MTLEQIEELLDQYAEVRRAAFKAALNTLDVGPAKGSAYLNEFYVEDGEIHVVINYDEPYSGQTTVKLKREDLFIQTR